MDEYKQTKFYWEIDVPIFKNNAILKDLGIALGIPLLGIPFGRLSSFSLLLQEATFPLTE